MKIAIQKLLKTSSNHLLVNGVPRPKHESILIFKEVLKKEYLEIMLDTNHSISSKKVKMILNKTFQRARGKPISKIFGKKEFFSHDFFTSIKTLDPRPETEHLIDVVVNISKRINSNDLDILDLGTGTGCIIITLFQKLIKKFNVSAEAVDISKDALKVARRNLDKFNLKNKIKLNLSNWFENVNSKFDIIVSNPPYIRRRDISSLEKGVLYDPIISLDGGVKGLTSYQSIAEKAASFLKPNGYIVCEIGTNQLKSIDKIFIANRFERILKEKDLQGIDRIVVYKYKQIKNTLYMS